jgi:hypothetical protein
MSILVVKVISLLVRQHFVGRAEAMVATSEGMERRVSVRMMDCDRRMRLQLVDRQGWAASACAAATSAALVDHIIGIVQIIAGLQRSDATLVQRVADARGKCRCPSLRMPQCGVPSIVQQQWLEQLATDATVTARQC